MAIPCAISDAKLKMFLFCAELEMFLIHVKYISVNVCWRITYYLANSWCGNSHVPTLYNDFILNVKY